MSGPNHHIDQKVVSEGLARVDRYIDSLEELLTDIGRHRQRLDAIETALKDCLMRRNCRVPQMEQRGYWGKRTSAREALVESMAAVSSSLMMARAQFVRVLVDEEGYSVSEVALFLGNARQLTKRLYDAAWADDEIVKVEDRSIPAAAD
jgi:hypothetical protein